ncbi:NRD1 protein, partial [Sphaerosporella brunnea]
MSSVVTELEAALQAMQNAKPPGVSGTKIAFITELSVNNVQSESVIIQKLYTHFKKCPGTHKLGPLYVVDSIARKYLDQAKKNHQDVSSSAPDGTFAAGVFRITNLLPPLMNDILQNAPPEENKDKIEKLYAIWERSSTFPPEVLADVKKKMKASPMFQSQSKPALSPQYNTPNAQPNGHNVTIPNTSTPAPLPSVPHSIPFTTTPPNVNTMPAFPGQLLGVYPGYSQQTQPQAPYPQYGAPQQQQPQINMEQLALLQLLLQQPQNAAQLAPAFQALFGGAAANFQMPNVIDPSQQQQQQQQFWSQNATAAPPSAPAEAQRGPDNYNNDARGRERGYSPPPRSPPRYGARRGRSRSRSPAPTRFGREEARSPPTFRRRSPVYGEYEGNTNEPARGANMVTVGGNDRGGRGRRGRKVSPRGVGRKSSPVKSSGSQASPPPSRPLPKVPRNVTFADDIPSHCVRVLSRTLFVGGVTIGDDELRQLFENYGLVQSCIVNQDKRHAFIKMLTREDAVKAKAGMETYRTDNMTLRTRWGVGFGPRDCSDYQTGISVIPIERLTEADQRWMVSAEYGGTGGQPLQGGMCVEEPDIEIGQGVSSKAISKRFPTDSGGNKGPRSS